jgi:Cu-Zn family superoxide dismutase
MRTTTRIIGIAALTALIGLGGAAAAAQDETEESGWSVPLTAMAPILDASGKQLGYIAVGNDGTENGGLIMVQGLFAGDHGVHLHETGNCDPAGEKTFEKAGAHFNPGKMTHPHHVGDLGNLTADANGNAVYLFDASAVNFDDGAFGVADADGTALVIHADPDDLATDPSGNSGARIACAVLFPPR